MEHFVQVVSANVKVSKTVAQIEKIQMLKIWCMKASAFLTSFRRELEKLEKCNDEQKRGVLIERCESLYMAAVTTYLRCFHDQPTFYLKIKDVTKEEDLLSEYADIKSLRDDEFVHWKGVNSRLTVLYSLEVITPNSVDFARNINIQFTSNMKYFATETMERLFVRTLKYLEEISNKRIEGLRGLFRSADTWQDSDFLNPHTGQSIINRPT